jgi:uncharacterized cupin superfamily protein
MEWHASCVMSAAQLQAKHAFQLLNLNAPEQSGQNSMLNDPFLAANPTLENGTRMSKNDVVPRFHVATTAHDPLPEYGGTKAILYHSADRKRLAASFHESGTARMTMPFDDFSYVVAGSGKITVDGGEPINLNAGDAFYLKQGQDVQFVLSDDFHVVTMLMSDDPIEV